MSGKRLVAQLIAVAAVAGLLVAGSAPAATTRTEVVVADDWPADAFIDPGSISCPGGEVQWLNPATPVCTGSGRLHLRKAVVYGCTQAQATASGNPEPRMTGIGVFEVNGNLDAEYSGRVWGKWEVLPGACDVARLSDLEAPSWRGTWQGRRLRFCDGANCLWIGDLELVGKGHGGALEGLRFKGTETVTTFTPLSLPWELIGLCPPLCGPEGVAVGTIME